MRALTLACSICVVSLGVSSSQAQTSSFTAYPVWASGSSDLSYGVAFGDMDGDGDLDLVCGNVGQSAKLYRNDAGQLGTEPAWTSGPEDNTRGIALGDVDGDGDLDLICGNDGQTTKLYRNEGGTLSTEPVWATEHADKTYAVALGDVDADGDLDLVCGNYGEGTKLYRNDGGTFATEPIWTSRTTDKTSAVALGDVNGDGAIDLVCGQDNIGASGIELYLNVSGTFGSEPSWSLTEVGLEPRGLALGDIDGDWKLDLVSRDLRGLRLYRNTGDGFGVDPVWATTTSSFTKDVAVGDVDGDGDLDLVCGGSLYRNDAGTLGAEPVWIAGSADYTVSVALGDVDQDGDLDLVCGNTNQSVKLYRNDLPPFPPLHHWIMFSTDRTASVVLGDVDNDGDLDLVCGNLGQSTRLYRNIDGYLDPEPIWSSGPADDTYEVALGDVDGDGYADLVCGNHGATTNLYRNEGGTFGTEPVWTTEASAFTFSIALADMDGDGDLDLLCGNYNGGTKLYRNEQGQLSPQPVWASLDLSRKIAVGDMDGDSDLDLVVLNAGNLTLYRNHWGVLGTTNDWGFVVPDWEMPVQNHDIVELADVDGDGDADLLLAGHSKSTQIHFSDVGVFGVAPAWSSALTNEPTYSVALGDVDGDGDLDLACGNVNLFNRFYRNDGGRLQAAPVWSSNIVADSRSVALGDVDGDGDLDLVAGGFDAKWLYLARSTPAFNEFSLFPPHHHLPNNDAFLRHVRIAHSKTQPYSVTFTAYDVESDPIWVRAEYQVRGGFHWHPVEVVGQNGNLGPLASSPAGVAHDFAWDVLRVLRGPIVLRLLTISNPSRAGVIQRVASYTLEVGPVEPLRPWIRTDAAVSFPVVTLGDSTSTDLEITNVGSALLQVNAIELPSPDMWIARDVPFVVEPHATDAVHVQFRGREAGNIVGNVTITNSDPLDPQHVVPLSARVRALGFSMGNLNPTGVIAQGEALHLLLTMRDSTSSDSAKVFFRPTGKQSYEGVSLVFVPGPPDDQYTGSIPADMLPPRGVEYHPVVYNGTAQSVGSGRSLRTQVEQLSFPYAQPAGRYRIISMPLETEGSALDYLIDDLGSLDVSRWRLYRYQPGDSAYTELTHDTLFPLQLGHAYWLIAKEAIVLDVNPPGGATASSDRDFELVLEPGWNMLSNPFNFPVAWASVGRSANVRDPVEFDPVTGTYRAESPAILEPFSGYFIRNGSAARETLFVPPVEASPLQPLASSTPTLTQGIGEDWQFTLRVRTEKSQDGENILGVRESAKDSYDSFDREEPPPPPGSWVRLAFANHDWKVEPGLYQRDLRSTAAEGQTWNLEVTSASTGEEVRLDGWLSAGMPAGLVVRLVDVEQEVAVDLHGTEAARDGYTLLSRGPGSPYRLVLLAGTERYVGERELPLRSLPRVVLLEQNAPNPFNPSTRIRFGLPAPATVHLEIYDVRGKRVAVLVAGERFEAGYHTVIWNGTSSSRSKVASGVYFYRLQTDAATLIRKMLVTK